MRRAEEAVRFYHAYKGEKKGQAIPTLDEFGDKFKERMRQKHYAYSTERSYPDWSTRFREYTAEVLR